MRLGQRSRWIAAAALAAGVVPLALGCGGRQSRASRRPAPVAEVAPTESPRVVLPPDLPGDGYSITIGEAGSLVLNLPSGARHYAVVGSACEGLGTGRAPAMGGRVSVPGARARGLAVTMEDRLLAIDLPEVPPSSGLAVSITYAAFSGGDHLHGEFVRSCSSSLTAWAADPTGERTSPQSLAAGAAAERDADSVASAEIAAGACNSESLRLLADVDSNLEMLLNSANLIRGHREHVLGTGQEVLRGLIAPAAGTYHVLVVGWRPIQLTVVGRDGPFASESPFARLAELHGWSVASRSFSAEAAGRFGLRISTHGCFATYVYYEPR